MKKVSCRKAFTDQLLENARENPDILALATDSGGSVTLGGLMKELPAQYIELGIAEQNAVAVGAGLSLTGKTVFVCGPACFLAARSFEQIKVDVAYNNTNVKIMGVSAGVSYGPLGGTHTSLHDFASMRALPNLRVLAPSDNVQAAFLADYLCKHEGPAYVRMGRGDVPGVYEEGESFEIEKAKLVRQGKDLTIIACGEMVYPAIQAAELLAEKGVSARVLDLFSLKPFDAEAIEAAARETGAILTAEEHSVNGGLGELVAHAVALSYPVPMEILGFPDEEAAVGKPNELFEFYGLTPANMAARALKLLERNHLR